MAIAQVRHLLLRVAPLLAAGVFLALAVGGCGGTEEATIHATERASLGKAVFTEGYVAHLRLEAVDGTQVFDVKFDSKQPVVRKVPPGDYTLTSYIVSYYQAENYCRKPISLRSGQSVGVKVVTRANECSIEYF